MKNIKAITLFFVLIFSFCSINSFAQNKKALKLQSKASTYFDVGEYEKAIEYCDKSLKKDNTNFKTFVLKGMSYYKLNQYQSAIDNYNQAIKIEPNNYFVYCFKAQCYNDTRDYDRALKQYKKALTHADSDSYPMVYNNIGNVYLKSGKYTECINAYKKAVELDESNHNYYYNLAKGYSAIGDYKKAIETNKITIKLNPDSRQAYNNMGINYTALKDYHQAIKMLKKALQLKTNDEFSNDTYPYNNLAFCYLNINMLDKAIEYAEKSKALDSNNSYVYFTLAGIAAFKKDHEGFYEQLIKAHNLGFPLQTRLDESFLKPYLEEERFKSFLK